MKHFNFFRLFLVLWMLLCNVFVFADDLITEQVVVNVEEPGTLPDKISDADKDRITDLKIIGELNGTDVRFVREMAGADFYNKKTAGNLCRLDMTEATFGEGGEAYCHSEYGSSVSLGSWPSSSQCDYFLSHCSKIEYVKLGDGITKIGNHAFEECSNLTDVELSSKVEAIGSEAFYYCSSLQKIVIPKSVKTIEFRTFMGCKNLKKVELPDELNEISSQAFNDCSKLDYIKFPKKVASISKDAFKDCNALSNIDIPSLESWMNISQDSHWCTAVHLLLNGEEITNLVIPNSVKVIKDNAFYNCGYIKTVIFPKTVEKINNWAFHGCASLTSVDLNDEINELGWGAFYNCTSLENVKFPARLKTIGGIAFAYCSSLKKAVLPNEIEKLDMGAFANCSSLYYVSIPESVNAIGNGVFSCCEKLKALSCFWGKPIAISLAVFQDTYDEKFDFNNCTLYVPQGSYEAYRTADVWKDFGTIKTIGSENPQEPKDPEPCSIPTITYTSGNLSFESSTLGAEYHYTIKDADVATDKYNTDGQVQLNGKLDISVYATADGYKASDKAMATLYWLNAEGGDDTNNINLVKTRGVMVTTDSDITISGLNDGEVVTFYSVNGVNLGSAKAVQGVLHFAKPNESIVIAKIKGNDLKIAIK